MNNDMSFTVITKEVVEQLANNYLKESLDIPTSDTGILLRREGDSIIAEYVNLTERDLTKFS